MNTGDKAESLFQRRDLLMTFIITEELRFPKHVYEHAIKHHL